MEEHLDSAFAPFTVEELVQADVLPHGIDPRFRGRDEARGGAARAGLAHSWSPNLADQRRLEILREEEDRRWQEQRALLVKHLGREPRP